MQQVPIFSLTRQAAGAVPANRFVGLDDNVCAAGAAAWGVSDFEASAAGKLLNVKVLGSSKVQVGAAVTPGQLVKSDAAGRAIPQGGAGAVLGRVIVGSAAVDGVAEILLLPSAA
jgi:hypothetical protein